MPQFSFIIASLVFVAVLLWGERRDDGRIRWFAKPAASFCFVLVALAGGGLDSVYGQWVLGALVLCTLGDILLIPSGPKTFLAGMAAFALGHGAYIGAFLSGSPEAGLLFYVTAAAMAIFAAFTLRWLWPQLAAFRWPVTGYAAIIGVMVSTSVLAAPPGASSPSIIVILGAVGFAISDLAVAKDRFVRPQFFNRLWGLPLYYGAQLMLAASV